MVSLWTGSVSFLHGAPPAHVYVSADVDKRMSRMSMRLSSAYWPTSGSPRRFAPMTYDEMSPSLPGYVHRPESPCGKQFPGASQAVRSAYMKKVLVASGAVYSSVLG